MAKRELIAPNGDKRFIRRDARGRITESEDQGRSLAQDRRRQAKNPATPGQGDRGDRKASSPNARSAAVKKTSKKTAAKSTAKKSTASQSASGRSPASKGASKAASKSPSTAASKSASKKAASSRSQASKSAAKQASRGRADGASRGPSAIQLLKDDHAKVRGLLEQLDQTTARGGKTRTELLAKIAQEIEVHSKLEEEIFYPAFQAAGERGDDDKMYFEALEEHRAAGDLVLPDLLSTNPSSDRFGGRAKVLKELIEHHAREEEREMFPRARELLSTAQLQELGARMLERKQELLAAPAAGPKSATAKLVEAVAGVFTGGSTDEDGEAGDGSSRGGRSSNGTSRERRTGA